MDEAVSRISSEPEAPIVIITASYEGQPPDNAASFAKWLATLEQAEGAASLLARRVHAVYGCGHRDWVDTFQKVPSWVDSTLSNCGSRAVTARGVSDAANDNIFNEFDAWADDSLWPALAQEYYKQLGGSVCCPGGKKLAADRGAGRGLVDLKVVRSSRSTELHPDSREGIVLETQLLTAPGDPEKRHLKVQLPEGMKYAARDYLAVLPINHDDSVKSVMNRFGLMLDAQVLSASGFNTAQSSGPRHLSVYSLLRELVELNHPATDKVRLFWRIIAIS